ncbi:hypothetical protein HK101_000370 [Irineochytrium annulatum]|nr:hypothetical protein HK101_000370 [Irineochytrium annulatum]
MLNRLFSTRLTIRPTARRHALPSSLSTAVCRRPLSSSSAAAAGTDGEQRITKLLTASLEPTAIQVQDISGGCGAMYAVNVTSAKFKGLPLVKQHRMVVDSIKAEIENAHGADRGISFLSV